MRHGLGAWLGRHLAHHGLRKRDNTPGDIG